MVDIRRGQSGEFSDSRYWAASATAGECQGQPFRARSSPEEIFFDVFSSLVLEARFLSDPNFTNDKKEHVNNKTRLVKKIHLYLNI